MQISRPRFSVRWLMIVTGLIGMAIAYLRLEQFSRMYDRRVAYHDLKRTEAEGVGDFRWDGKTWVARGGVPPDQLRAAYHASMARKYKWHARHPWLNIPSDEPEPE